MSTLSLFLNAEPAHAAAEAHAASSNPVDSIIQLFGSFGVDGPHLLAQLINFSILAFVLYRFAIKPALGQLEERIRQAEQLQSDRASAEQKLADARKHAEQLLTKASDEAAKLLTDARNSAKQTVEGAKAEASAAQAEIARKGAEAIEADRRKMMNEVRGEVSRLVVETAAKVLEQNLDDAQRVRLNEAATKQLASR
ncbi:MAG: ATP synthase F0 subunit B [bacterium]